MSAIVVIILQFININILDTVYIYAITGFTAGFIIAWIIRMFAVQALKKSNKSLQGYLESEKLRKETLLKENTALHEMKKAATETHDQLIKHLYAVNKRLDEDILLLQKSNEETEGLLREGLPVVHSLKLQLIEANNTIARYKAQLERIPQ